jgi:hypothetical protein
MTCRPWRYTDPIIVALFVSLYANVSMAQLYSERDGEKEARTDLAAGKAGT